VVKGKGAGLGPTDVGSGLELWRCAVAVDAAPVVQGAGGILRRPAGARGRGALRAHGLNQHGGMNFEGGLQLCDGEMSWPQERPSSRCHNHAPLTSSDLNLLRLSGVPRARQVSSHTSAANPDSDAHDADGANGGVSWPQCLPEAPANPRSPLGCAPLSARGTDCADSYADVDDNADGGGSWPQCTPRAQSRGKAAGRRRPPALAVTPISQDGIPFDPEPPSPSNGGDAVHARPQSAASRFRSEGVGCGRASGGMAMAPMRPGGGGTQSPKSSIQVNLYKNVLSADSENVRLGDAAPMGPGGGQCLRDSQAETPELSLCRPRRSNVTYMRRGAN
jgi:hypothetical protein